MSTQADPWAPPTASPGGPSTAAGLKPLTVTYRIEDAELGTHTMSALIRSPAVVFFVVLSIVALISAARGPSSDWKLTLPIITVLFFFMSWRAQKNRLKNLREPQRTIIMELTEPHLVIADLESRMMFAWPNFTHYEEVATAFRIFEVNRQFRVLPKKVMSEDEIDLARRWFARQLPAKPKTGSSSGSIKTLIIWAVLIAAFWAIYQVIAESHRH